MLVVVVEVSPVMFMLMCLSIVLLGEGGRRRTHTKQGAWHALVAMHTSMYGRLFLLAGSRSLYARY
jgi:hypothetical protein